MEKRKRTASLDHPSSGSMPCSSGRYLTTEEDGFDTHYRRMFKRFSSARETMDVQGKQLSTPLSVGQHHYNMSRAIYSKRNRHHNRNQSSRRNSSNNQSHRPSTSNGKGNHLRDEKLCFKLGGGYNPEFGHQPDFAEKGFWQPERIRRSQSLIDVLSPEGLTMVCGLCGKQLRRKTHNFGTTLAPEELSVVAVLVCGHIYHADCLEQRTSPEDIRDPPCPTCSSSCSGSLTKTEAA